MTLLVASPQPLSCICCYTRPPSAVDWCAGRRARQVAASSRHTREDQPRCRWAHADLRLRRVQLLVVEQYTTHTQTLYYGLLSSVLRASLHLPMQDASSFFLLEGRRTSGWSSSPFTFYLSFCWRRSCRERTSVMNQSIRWKL